MIPKTLHYCWFGNNPKPKLAEKCIKSWKKQCPNFELIEWNEENFDINSSPLYVRQAYEEKKWAFVADYVRLWALTRYGGIYLDTDVELVKPVDKFITHRAFSGFEDGKHIQTGIIASEKGFSLFVELMHYYDDAVFVKADGSYNLTTNVTLFTIFCIEHGLIQNNKYQEIEDIAIYPSEVFSPLNIENGRVKRTNETVAVHWFDGSWHTKDEKKEVEKGQRYIRKQERKALVRNILKEFIGESDYQRLKRVFKK